MNKVTIQNVTNKIEHAKELATEGTVGIFDMELCDAREYAKQLGTTLPELGYPDETIHVIETEALTNGVARKMATAGEAFNFDDNLSNAREYAKRLGTTLPELGYPDEVICMLETESLTKGVAKQIEYAKNGATHGCVSAFETHINVAQKYAERLGATLPELGYSDEAIHVLETKALTNGVVSRIETAIEFASEGQFTMSEINLDVARQYAERLETTVTALIGPKETAIAQKALAKLGKNVDALLGVKPPTAPGGTALGM